jgi:hypothetical protein
VTLLFRQFSQTSSRSLSLSLSLYIYPPFFYPIILLSTLFSDTLNLCSSLHVRDKDSHPYRTTGKIIFLYISTSKRLDLRNDDKTLRAD